VCVCVCVCVCLCGCLCVCVRVCVGECGWLGVWAVGGAFRHQHLNLKVASVSKFFLVPLFPFLNPKP